MIGVPIVIPKGIWCPAVHCSSSHLDSIQLHFNIPDVVLGVIVQNSVLCGEMSLVECHLPIANITLRSSDFRLYHLIMSVYTPRAYNCFDAVHIQCSETVCQPIIWEPTKMAYYVFETSTHFFVLAYNSLFISLYIYMSVCAYVSV
jgi:hypothetical protein